MPAATYQVPAIPIHPERHPLDRIPYQRRAPHHIPRKLVLADIPRDIHEVLAVLADEQGVSANALASELLAEAIKRTAGEAIAAVVNNVS